MISKIYKYLLLLVLSIISLQFLSTPINATTSAKLTPLPVSYSSKTLQYSSIEAQSELNTVKSGSQFFIAITITPDKNWHTYWINPGDSGAAPIIDWNLPKGFSIIEEYWPAPKKFPYGPLTNYGYHAPTTFLYKVQAPQQLPLNTLLNFSINFDYLVCSDTCIPETDSLSLSIKSGLENKTNMIDPLIEKAKKQLPQPFTTSYNITSYKNEINIILEKNNLPIIQDGYFFPKTDDIVNTSTIQQFQATKNQYILTIKTEALSNLSLDGVLQLKSNKEILNYTIQANTIPEKMISYSKNTFFNFHFSTQFFTTLLFAFIGGLILNVMPCVFPIFSLKALSLAEHKDLSKFTIQMNALLYGLGCIVSMWIMYGIIYLFKVGGTTLGWGFHLQNPIIVTLLFYLMVYIGFYLLDMAPLPTSLHILSGKINAHQSSSSFWIGVLAVIIATPCTAPFMAASIGYAFSQPFAYGITAFTALGVGFSFPFIVIGIFPKLTHFLPKPGNWLVLFKEICAYPMFLTAIWLLWVLHQQVTVNSVFITLSGTVILAFYLWLYRSFPKQRFISTLICVSFICSNIYLLQTNTSTNTTLNHTYTDPSIISTLINNKKTPLLVEVTASWCITCQINEKLVLNTQKTRNLLKKHNVTFVKLDWTNKSTAITMYLESFGRKGIPLYVYYNKIGEPTILPQLLSINTLRQSIQAEEKKKK